MENELFLASIIKKGLDGIDEKVGAIGALVGADATWKQIQQMIRGGLGPNAYPVGTQFTVTHTKYGSLLFDVIAHDHHKNPNDPAAHTMTLLMHDVIYTRPFDGVEAAYLVTAENHADGLPAGTYHFLIPAGYTSAEAEGWTGIQFTTTETVPVGGHIVFAWISGNVSAAKISTYESATATTAIESNLALSNGTGGTSLGTMLYNSDNANGYMNHLARLRYGSNNWNESNIRQWLNSDAASGWWTPKTPLDRLSSTYAALEGFLNGMDSDFAAALGEVDVVTRKNSVFEADSDIGTKTYTTRDKIFLLSNDEVGFAVEGIAQGSVVDFYNGAANADRIKYDYSSTATARNWWLRSPNPGGADNARIVSRSGAQNNHSACSGIGAAAACVIY